MANKLVEIFIQVRDEASGAFDRLKGAIGRVGDSVMSLKGLFLGLVAGAVAKGIESLVDAFIEQEKVTVRLNSALRVTGRFTQDASDAMHKMADDMRTLTTHTDEEALGVSAQFASLARELTTKQLAEAQKVAIGLADATGMSVERASMLMIRSITGQGNALKRWGVDLDTAATQQEKFNEIQRKLGPLFQISVESAKTLGGAIAQSKNEFNELKETLGTVIVESFGLHDAATGLRDTFKRWNEEIKAHIGTWIYWGRIVFDVLKVIGVSLWAAVQIAYNTGKAFGAAFSLGIDMIVLGIEGFINDRIIAVINAAFTQLDALAHKFGKSFSFRLGEIETDSVTDQIKIDLDQWQQAVEGVDGALKGVRDTYGKLSTDVTTHPLPKPEHTAGAGANLGTAETGPNAAEQLRGALETQKQLKAQYDAGVITLEVYNRRLEGVYFTLERLGQVKAMRALRDEQEALDKAVDAGSITREKWAHDTALIDIRMKELTKSVGLTAPEVTQLYEAMAKLKDVKIGQILAEQEGLTLKLQRGQIGAKEYDDAIKDLVNRMEALLRIAGLTEEQIKKITKAMLDAGKSTIGIGPQMERAFGLQEGGGMASLKAANEELAKMAFGLATAFTDAIGQAIAAGGGFGKVIKAAVGQAAASFAKMSVGRALMEVAEGIAASLVPGKQAEAGAHFAAAKVFGAAAVFMGGIAGATGGFSGGGAGSGGGSPAFQGTAQKGNAYIHIEGGLLDMSNPDQAESLRKAVAELTDREVFLD